MWYSYETAAVNLNDFSAIFKISPGNSYKNIDSYNYSIVFENKNLLKYISYESKEKCDNEFDKILTMLGCGVVVQISRCC